MISVAIDGPSGAGKSTIARRAAQTLSFIYVDTGALYRTVGLYMAEHGVENTKNAEAVAAKLSEVSVDLRFIDGEQRVFLNGEDVSGRIRTPQMAMHASNVSAIPAVRAFLLDMQRDLAKKNNVIMDGRDIGTVILPDADLKLFLICPAEERAKRRVAQLEEAGMEADYDQILQDIYARDERDTTRAISPLRKAEDAIEFNTTGHTAESSAEEIIERFGLCRK